MLWKFLEKGTSEGMKKAWETRRRGGARAKPMTAVKAVKQKAPKMPKKGGFVHVLHPETHKPIRLTYQGYNKKTGEHRMMSPRYGKVTSGHADLIGFDAKALTQFYTPKPPKIPKIPKVPKMPKVPKIGKQTTVKAVSSKTIKPLQQSPVSKQIQKPAKISKAPKPGTVTKAIGAREKEKASAIKQAYIHHAKLLKQHGHHASQMENALLKHGYIKNYDPKIIEGMKTEDGTAISHVLMSNDRKSVYASTAGGRGLGMRQWIIKRHKEAGMDLPKGFENWGHEEIEGFFKKHKDTGHFQKIINKYTKAVGQRRK